MKVKVLPAPGDFPLRRTSSPLPRWCKNKQDARRPQQDRFGDEMSDDAQSGRMCGGGSWRRCLIRNTVQSTTDKFSPQVQGEAWRRERFGWSG